MYKSANVAKIIKKTAKAKNIQLKDMLIELGLSKDTLSNMYRESMLKGDEINANDKYVLWNYYSYVCRKR